MSERVYKIRNTDGLFSSGGTYPSWDARGKEWRQIGHVKTHIRFAVKHMPDVYAGAEVVAYDLVEIESETMSAGVLADGVKERMEQERRVRAEAWERYREALEKADLLRLRAKYGVKS